MTYRTAPTLALARDYKASGAPFAMLALQPRMLRAPLHSAVQPCTWGAMYDFSIVGGGIVGASVARQLAGRHPGARICLLEKESRLARHQTGRNSGVIHSGIYYRPGSLKARLCRAGVAATIDFCEAVGIRYEQRGKLIVATDEKELDGLSLLEQRAAQNGIDVERLDAAGMAAAEPNVRGEAALFVPSTGIVDWGAVCEALAADFEAAGGTVRTGSRVVDLEERADSVRIRLSDGETISTRCLVACAGLQSDRLAAMLGIETGLRIVPYRGDYYRLPGAKKDLVRHLIYPVPDPALPFLGVHLTPMIDGSLTVGPSALQSLAREGYDNYRPRLDDVLDLVSFPGFWRVSARYWRTGLSELAGAVSKRRYLARVRAYCPSIELADLKPYPPGIRAQAVSRDGRLLDDFHFAGTRHSLLVLNAPSPAATSAIPVGEYICDELDKRGQAG